MNTPGGGGEDLESERSVISLGAISSLSMQHAEQTALTFLPGAKKIKK